MTAGEPETSSCYVLGYGSLQTATGFEDGGGAAGVADPLPVRLGKAVRSFCVRVRDDADRLGALRVKPQEPIRELDAVLLEPDREAHCAAAW